MIAIGVVPVRILVFIAAGIGHAQHLIVGILVVRIADVAEPAEDLVGSLDGPGDLVLLRATRAIRAANEVDPRSIRDQLEDLCIAQGHDGCHGALQTINVLCGCILCHQQYSSSQNPMRH